MENKSNPFFATLDLVLGFYLDSTIAYSYVIKEIERSQQLAIQKFSEKGEEWTIEKLNKKAMILGRGDPNSPEAVHLHRTTQRQFKERNRPNGQNHTLIGNLCAVMIYQFWEDHFRREVADILGYKKNQVKVDSFGELRYFRRSIIHNNGVAIKDVEKCTIFPWFHEGDLIAFSEEQFEELVRTLGKSVKAFVDPCRPNDYLNVLDE